MRHELKEPFTKDKLKDLRAGDTVLLTGTIYAARDAAHKKLLEMIESGDKLPIEIENQIVYYAGPTPARPGNPIGSVGPTTSYRMDALGPRNEEVRQCSAEAGAVYFAAIGGAGALIAKSIKSSEVVAFAEMGTEAIRKLYVEDLPLIVAYDAEGGDVFFRG